MIDIILQKDLYERSKEVFEYNFQKYSINHYLANALDEKLMLTYHRQGINIFVIGAETYSYNFFNSIKPNSLIIRYGVGYSSIPIDLCRKKNIYVAYTPGTLNDSVAEYTIGLMLSLARYIPMSYHEMLNNRWKGITGFELKNKTLAILGYGQIGQSVARIAKLGFQMKINAFDKYITKDNIADIITSDYNTAVENADIISLHLSASKELENFINKDRINAWKDGAIFINTSRGCLVNEQDLYQALLNNKIAGAAIDVFKEEPYFPRKTNDIDLSTLSNVITTPHCGSNSVEANNRMALKVIKNIISFSRGEEITIIPELKK